MQTTKFGNTIRAVALGYAAGWAAQNCSEKNNVPNRTSCFQYLFDNDYKKVIGNPWCAALLHGTIRKACERYGIRNPYTWSLASRSIVDQSKKIGVRIDNNPVPGCAFWYDSHTGFVYDRVPGGLITVEGNSSDNLLCRGCPKNGVVVVGNNSKPRSLESMKEKGTVYIHIEELAGTDYVSESNAPLIAGNGGSGGNIILPALLFSAAIGGIIYANS